MTDLTHREIEMALTIDTTEAQRTLLVREARVAQSLLVDAVDAVAALDAGDTDVTREFVDRAIVRLIDALAVQPR